MVNFITKDEYKLSWKQYAVLYYHFDWDYEITNDFVANNTYDEISKKISYALSHKVIKPNEHENAGDRQ